MKHYSIYFLITLTVISYTLIISFLYFTKKYDFVEENKNLLEENKNLLEENKKLFSILTCCTEEKIILKSKLDVNYSIETYPLPFISYEHSWGKPGGYLDQIKSKVIIVNGNGSFYSFDKGDLNSKKIEFEKINTNIKDIIKDSDFYIKGSKTVRDLLIVNDMVLISYAKKQSDDCYNMSILISEFNFVFIPILF